MRAPEFDERLVPGHWERDLVKDNRSSVGTIVENDPVYPTREDGETPKQNWIEAQKRLSMTYD